MSKRYAIWDKVSPVATPSGEVFSAQQWIDRYPIAGLGHVIVVCSKGDFNGAIFATLGQMIQMAENDGCDFSDCITDQEKLDRIEEFEDNKAAKAAEAEANRIASEELNASSLASIAASMEYQNMMTLPDEEV